MTASDVPWAVKLLSDRRERLQEFAPVYWRPADDAEAKHAGFLEAVVQQKVPGGAGYRTDDAVLLVWQGPGEMLMIDDFALGDGASWSADGVALINALHGAKVRMVCPVPESDRLEFAQSLGLQRAHSWWHRELLEPLSRSARDLPAIDVAGVQAQWVDAPPVYAPGGPICFVREFADAEALAAAEAVAVEHRAALVVVQENADDAVAQQLRTHGYKAHGDFLDGALPA